MMTDKDLKDAEEAAMYWIRSSDGTLILRENAINEECLALDLVDTIQLLALERRLVRDLLDKLDPSGVLLEQFPEGREYREHMKRCCYWNCYGA